MKKAEYGTSQIELTKFININQNVVSVFENIKLEDLSGAQQMALIVYIDLHNNIRMKRFKLYTSRNQST